MTVTCTSFRTAVLPNGRIQLELDAPEADAMEERLSVKTIAGIIGFRPDTVLKLSNRKKNPLPLIRGNGRPYGLRTRINDWLAGRTDTQYLINKRDLRLARKVYGG